MAEAVGVVETSEIIEPGGKLTPAFLVEFEAREAGGGNARTFTEFLQRHRTAREAEHRKLVRCDFLPARPQIVECRNELTFGEVAGGAENDHGAGRSGLRVGDVNRVSHGMESPLKKWGRRRAGRERA